MSGTEQVQNGPIIYFAKLAPVIGGVTATILLQQIIYWHGKMNKHFYKYRTPCDKSQPGQSWCEELGFSPGEFDGARKKIATKLDKGKGITIETVFDLSLMREISEHRTIEGYLKHGREYGLMKKLVAYWTTQEHQTYYAFNQPLFDLLFDMAYCDKFPVQDFPNRKKWNQLIRNFAIGKNTENTTENTKDLLPQEHGNDGDILLCHNCGGYKQHSDTNPTCDDCMAEYHAENDAFDKYQQAQTTLLSCNGCGETDTIEGWLISNWCSSCGGESPALDAYKAQRAKDNTFVCKDCTVVSHVKDDFHYPEFGLCGDCIDNHPEYDAPGKATPPTLQEVLDELDPSACTSCGSKMLLCYGDDEVPTSTYYECVDCDNVDDDECPPMADLMRACMPTAPDIHKRIDGRDGSGWQMADDSDDCPVTEQSCDEDDSQQSKVVAQQVNVIKCGVCKEPIVGGTSNSHWFGSGGIGNYWDVCEGCYNWIVQKKPITPDTEPTPKAKKERKRSAKQLANDAMIEAIIVATPNLDRDKIKGGAWQPYRDTAKWLLLRDATTDDMKAFVSFVIAESNRQSWTYSVRCLTGKDRWPKFCGQRTARNQVQADKDAPQPLDASDVIVYLDVGEDVS